MKSLFDIRKDENLNFVVKDEQTGKPLQVKDVNSQKTFELFQKPFEYLYSAEYIPPEVKAELRQAAAADNLIGGNIGDMPNLLVEKIPQERTHINKILQVIRD